MSRQYIERSDYVRFRLQLNKESVLIMEEEPIGWKEDGLEIIRNKKYHGIFIQFSGGLKFTGDAKEFIRAGYDNYGINVNLFLIKEMLSAEDSYKLDAGIDVKWTEVYRGRADALTIKEGVESIEVNFNSNDLEDLIKSHESDEFELDRGYSIDNETIDPYTKALIKIKARHIDGIGESKDLDGVGGYQEANPKIFVSGGNQWLNRTALRTSFISKGIPRHIEANESIFSTEDSSHWQDCMFYNDVVSSDDGGDADVLNIDTTLKLRIQGRLRVNLTHRSTPSSSCIVYLQRFEYDAGTNNYQPVTIDGLSNVTYPDYPISVECNHQWVDIDEEIDFAVGDVKSTTTFAIQFQCRDLNYPSNSSGKTFGFQVNIQNFNIKLNETTIYDTDTKYNASFVNNVGSRLMEIMTGEKKKFYSRVFARNLNYLPSAASGILYGIPYQDYNYENTGEHGHVALIHGMDIRAFDKETSDLYKELTISLKKYIADIKATFNIGVGVEPSAYGQRLRFEKLEYFYQPYAVAKIGQIELKNRKVDKSMFFSACEFGSSKGGEYEHELGLDEPNVKSGFVTPLRRTDKKYNHISKIRSDEYGMALLQRFPAILNDKEDRTEDYHIWYLDLKWDNVDMIYTQLDWQDVLVSEPKGVQSPSSYHNWKFTPKRAFLRHGWVMRTGMEVFSLMEKEFSMINSNSNINLETQYIGEPTPIKENENVKVKALQRSTILPEEISFIHPIDDELMKTLHGFTEVLVEGTLELVPNWYFQVEFTNEKGAIERGYIKSIKPNKNEWVLWKANEASLF